MIDGGSTDGTLDILDSIKDPRLTVISKRLNLINSLNLGLTEARGKYIARMDADDVATPERLQTQVDFLEKNPEIVLLGSNAYWTDEQGRARGKTHLPIQPWWVNWNLFFRSTFMHPSVTMRRGFLLTNALRYGQVPPDWRRLYPLPEYIECEDYLFWALISRKGPVCNLRGRLVKLREHSASKSRTHETELRMAGRHVSNWNVSHFLGHHIPLDEWCSDRGPVNGFNHARFERWLLKLKMEFVRTYGLSGRQEALLQQDVEFRLRIASGVKRSFIQRCIVAGAVVAKTCLPPSLDHCRSAVRFLVAAGYEPLKQPPCLLVPRSARAIVAKPPARISPGSSNKP